MKKRKSRKFNGKAALKRAIARLRRTATQSRRAAKKLTEIADKTDAAALLLEKELKS